MRFVTSFPYKARRRMSAAAGVAAERAGAAAPRRPAVAARSRPAAAAGRTPQTRATDQARADVSLNSSHRKKGGGLPLVATQPTLARPLSEGPGGRGLDHRSAVAGEIGCRYC